MHRPLLAERRKVGGGVTWRWRRGRVGEIEARQIAQDGRELRARVGQVDMEKWAWRLDIVSESGDRWDLVASGISPSQLAAQEAAERAASPHMRQPAPFRAAAAPTNHDFRAARRRPE